LCYWRLSFDLKWVPRICVSERIDKGYVSGEGFQPCQKYQVVLFFYSGDYHSFSMGRLGYLGVADFSVAVLFGWAGVSALLAVLIRSELGRQDNLG